MLSPLCVRPVKASDFLPIVEIERESFGPDAYDRNLFAELKRKCGGLFLVASRGNKVLGYATTGVRSRRAELISIAVHSHHRGRGAAAALMDATLRRLRRRGVTRFVLMVKVTNHRAMAFYTKFDFRLQRRVPGYYEDGSDGFLYVKLL